MERLHTPVQAAEWLAANVTGKLAVDSRQIAGGDGFIAWPGFATDGRGFVVAAQEKGATACLIEHDGLESGEWNFSGGAAGSRIASYDGLKAASGPIAAAYYGEPSARIDVLAVTGTNGKTSTAWWLAEALASIAGSSAPLAGTTPAPRRCAVIGTLGIGTPGIGTPPDLVYTGLTTPDPVLLQKTFRDLVDGGFDACAIEASSIGIAERRLDGTRIRVAVFTNFTQDHLDYHGSMESYWQAKAELFRWPGLAAAVVNADDAQGPALLDEISAGIDVWTFGMVADARLRAHNVKHLNGGLQFDVVEAGKVESDPQETHALTTHLIGDYNVSNLLGVIGTLRALGVPLADAVNACEGLTPVPGRMQRVEGSDAQPLVVVDYAHTPDALDKALAALRPLAAQRGGRLWCVFGCGGDRDPIKRPMMGAVAEKGADVVVVTSDNPRSEKPEAIVSQVLLGLARPADAHVEVDRARAIADAIAQADAADVILLAGKGAEATQEIAGWRHPFSDVQHAVTALGAKDAQRGAA